MDLLAQMAMFVRVVETGSLSGAARAEGLSLPAVSRQLSALEQELGTSLARRSTRRLAITEAGRAWYEHSVRILREVADARQSVQSPAAVRGRLTVSAPVTIGMSHVVPRVPALLRKHPGLRLDLRLEDNLVDLVADAVDVVVRGGVPPPDSASLIGRPMLGFFRLPVAAPTYLKKHRPPGEPAELARHECLLQIGPSGALDRWRLAREKDQDTAAEVSVGGRLRASTPAALREAALSGLGVALLPDWLIGDDLSHHRLRRLLPGWTSGPFSAWALYRVAAKDSPLVRAFIDEMAPGPAKSPRDRAAVPGDRTLFQRK